jgi:hypothetical protein
MKAIPTAEDIKARRTVRFAAGHLAGHTDWTGVVVGYNDLYDTVHVYVDAPGNSESGSKITYSRKDVEWFEPAPVEHRETTVRVAGVERVIRTEVGGKIRTVKQLESAHTKSVKAAVIEMRRTNLDAYRLTLATLEAAPWSPARDRDIEATKRIIRRAERGTITSHGTPGVSTAPFPKVRYTTEIPEYLTEVAPGHYATAEAAEGLFDLPEVPEPEPTPPARLDGESFLDALLKSVAA